MPATFPVDAALRPGAGREAALHRVHNGTPDIESLSPSRTPLPPSLVVERVSKRFISKRGKVHALDDVSLEVAEGDFVCLVGPSGCGKSTLLNIIAGLNEPDAGNCWSDGKRVTGPGRNRMVMFQDPALFPWLDVPWVTSCSGSSSSPASPRHERRGVAQFYLTWSVSESFMHANVHELSGGMKQRVALARALAPEPACAADG